MRDAPLPAPSHREPHRPLVWIAACLLIISSAAPALTSPGVLPREALWSVVALCQTTMASVGLSFPCLEIRGSQDGFRMALLRPPIPRTHLLVTPVDRIAGIESPELRGPAGGAYLSMAWSARDKAGGALGAIPWDSAGMAINSAANRTQDQLHIHVNCLTPHAKASLANAAASWGEGWKVLWRGVWARVVQSEDLGAVDPLGPTIDKLPLGPTGLARLNFGVAGFEQAGGRRGFILLASMTSSLERILDTGCAVLQPKSRS